MILQVLFLLWTSCAGFTWADDSDFSATPSPLSVSSQKVFDPYYKVTDAIYRGRRPTYDTLLQLKELGIRTILNIESKFKAVEAEKKLAHEIGIKIITVPVSGFWSPKDPEIDTILGYLNEPSLAPIFLHCEFGRDRTGLVIGLHRVLVEGWSQKEAYSEMMEMGFRPQLVLLTNYFFKRTKRAEPLTF